jgi:hypothetical protein
MSLNRASTLLLHTTSREVATKRKRSKTSLPNLAYGVAVRETKGRQVQAKPW